MDKEGNAQLYRGHTQPDDAARFSLGCRAPTPDFVIHTYRICGIRMNGKYSYSYRNPCCPILERERERGGGRKGVGKMAGCLTPSTKMINDFVCMTSIPRLRFPPCVFLFFFFPFSLLAPCDGAEEVHKGASAPLLSLSLSLFMYDQKSPANDHVSSPLLPTICYQRLIKMLTNTRDPSCLKRISLILASPCFGQRARATLFLGVRIHTCLPNRTPLLCRSQQDLMTNFPPSKTFHLFSPTKCKTTTTPKH